MRLAAAALTAASAHEAADGEIREEDEDRGCTEEAGMREGMRERWAQLAAEAPHTVGGGEGEDGEEDAGDLQPKDR